MKDAFEETQVEIFHLIQEHMTKQDANFEAFASCVTERLTSMHNEMDVNHAAIISRINHTISAQNKNHYHYTQFYQEMFDFLDHYFGNDGQGWHHGVKLMPRGHGER